MFIEKELGIKGKANHDIFNMAADLTVNQYAPGIKDDIWGWIDNVFPGISTTLEKNKGAKYYYEQLVKYCAENGMVTNSSDGSSLGHSAELDKSIQDAIDKHKENKDGHDSWKDYEKLDENGKKLVQNQTDYQIKEAAIQTEKNRGTIPSHFKSLIDKLFKIEPPIFNWKSYFRRFLGFSSEPFVKKTLRKESKRFPDNAGLKVKFKQNILVGIDTSGSVSDDELREFFSEIHHIYKAGVGITIAECDAKLQRVYPYKGKFDGTITGRGGKCCASLYGDI